MKKLLIYCVLCWIILIGTVVITMVIVANHIHLINTAKPIILVEPCDVPPEDTLPSPPIFNTTKHQVKILEEVTSEHGTSVVFRQNGKEYGLDFLTRHELDSLKRL